MKMKANKTGIALGIFFALVVSGANAQDSIPITVTEVMSEQVAPGIPVAGTVFSRNEAQITAGIAGRLEWVAEPGDFIKAGAPVARFDCDMMRLQKEEQVAQVERARINVEILNREVGRLEKLHETFVTSTLQLERTQGDRDLAVSDMQIARVRIRQTESQLERCIATAPFSGVVTAQLQRAGADVERSTLIASMTDTQNLEVRASVPIRHLNRMVQGAVAEVSINNSRYDGPIRKIVPAANALSQTFEVRIDLPAAASAYVAAGQLVSARMPLSATSALTVPRDSIVLREEGAFVMRINKDSVAERVLIEVAEASGERVGVRGELSVGDRVAVRGAEALNEGQLVAVQSD